MRGDSVRFAVLLACHNRVGVTLTCLRRLFAARLPEGTLFDVWLNDDGSVDGTGSECRAFLLARESSGWRGRGYVLTGSGHDFWCGGMRRAWKAASRHLKYDGYLWLNDDTFLLGDAIEQMLDCAQGDSSIVVGSTRSSHGDGRTTYSGRDLKGGILEPNGEYQRAWGMNGNCVWIPQTVFARLGNFPSYFTHALGDFDYGLRAVESGIAIYQTPRHVGICDDAKKPTAWRDGAVPFVKRLWNLYSPIGGPEPLVFFRYNLSHRGVLWAVRCWIAQHIRVVFPSLERLV